MLQDAFTDPELDRNKWTIGVLATPQATFDASVIVKSSNQRLTIQPITGAAAPKFNGCVSVATFDLSNVRASVELASVASGHAVTLFAAVTDDSNWFGFRIENGRLYYEVHSHGEDSAKEVAYDAETHRYLRLRRSDVANLLVWETSADGKTWTVDYAETPELLLGRMHIVLGAGTGAAVDAPGRAAFDNVLVETK